jgi:serine/threonine protein kinase
MELYRTDKIKGTIEYLSPEMLRKYYGKCSDIWALGILILELSVNIPLFDRMGKQDILNTIKKCKIGKLVPNSLQTTIKDLLVNIFKFPPDRYPINKIKKHVFFKNIDWVNVLMRTEKLYDFEFPKTKDNSGIKEEYLFNQLE